MTTPHASLRHQIREDGKGTPMNKISVSKYMRLARVS
jgi:hypothetical protein